MLLGAGALESYSSCIFGVPSLPLNRDNSIGWFSFWYIPATKSLPFNTDLTIVVFFSVSLFRWAFKGPVFMQTKKILFVCLGNICRSPLAEGVFREHVLNAGLQDRYEIDSAGTGSWHVGHLPDARSIEVALKYGIDIRGQRARQVELADIEGFHQVVAMDRSNQRDLVDLGFRNVTLLREYGTEEDDLEVPDPYYGGPDGFEVVYRMVDRCCRGLLVNLQGRQGN